MDLWGTFLKRLESTGIIIKNNGTFTPNWQAAAGISALLSVMTAINFWSYLPIIAELLAVVGIAVLIWFAWKNEDKIKEHISNPPRTRKSILGVLVILIALVSMCTIPNLIYHTKALELNGQGDILRGEKRFDEAITFYEKAIFLDPNYVDPWIGKGYCLKDQEKLDDALNCFIQAIHINSYCSQAWEEKGKCLGEKELFDEAIVCYNIAIDLGQNTAALWEGRGWALYHLEKYDDALTSFDNAGKVHGDKSTCTQPWIGKGWSYFRKNNITEAEVNFNIAIDVAPKAPGPWVEKGHFLFEQKKYNESVGCFKEAVALAPSDSYAKWWYDESIKYI